MAKNAKVASRKTANNSAGSSTSVKDDGHLYGVFDASTNRRVYPGGGVVLGEAERLGGYLAAPAYIKRVDA